MSNLSKLFAFWSLLILQKGLAANSDEQEKISNLMSHYRTLVASGALEVIPNAKYMASIKRMDIDTGYAEHHICAGAVVSDNSILTTAACTFDENRPLQPSELVVVVGISYGSMYDQFAQILTVKTIRRHNNYNPKTDDNNIAVLVLNSTIVPIRKTVDAIHIATKAPVNYQVCKVLGFGVLFFQDIKLSQILQGELKVWPKSLCSSYLKKQGKSENHNFCAGDLKDLKTPTCKLLASEPLICDDVLYGVSVLNVGCDNTKGFAAAYVNVWDYSNWISDHAEGFEMLSARSCDLKSSKFLVNLMFLGSFYWISN